jgi:Ferredoxin-like domain in Api92-like protein
MPNWCSNRATITGPAPVIKKIADILKQDDSPLLAWMVPQPNFEGDQNWYNWNVANWGTKWDISDVYIDNEAEEDSIEFLFSSAWSPPVEAFAAWAGADGRVQFTLEYWEPGCGYVGTTTYDGEYLDTDDVDCNSDPARYKEIASDVWGYEEYEEPEPLTEWYKDGVEARGLA